MATLILQPGEGELYRDFVMYRPHSITDAWTAWHKDADEDDDRNVCAKSRSELMEEIDEWHADQSWERTEIYRLRAALEKQAVRFEHCADLIASSFNISGTLRAERAEKAMHFAIEAREAARGSQS